MNRFLIGLLVVVGATALNSTDVYAQSIQIEPLLINESLQPAEKKKGYVDISNPTGQSLQLTTSVQAFRQKDNNGGLEFFDNEQVTAGLVPDLADFELGPKEVLRLYFLVDGTKLPQGDVFAALFVSTKANQESAGVSQAVKLGTIFTLVNETPGARVAEITALNIPFFQFGDSINGAFLIKNIADPKTTTGFYPEVSLKLSPFGSDQSVRSSLIMSGVERSMGFSLPDSRFGFYQMKATHGTSEKATFLFVITGIWKIIVPAVTFLALLITVFIIRKRRGGRYYKLLR